MAASGGQHLEALHGECDRNVRKRSLRPASRRAMARREAPGIHSKFDLLRQHQGIIDLDSEIADGAFDFRMSKKKLYRP